jgi:molybdopterin converting factor small subunit
MLRKCQLVLNTRFGQRYSIEIRTLNRQQETKMSTVYIPTPLRRLTAGASKLDIAGNSVGEVLLALESDYPGIASKVFDQEGQVKRFINVFKNDDEIRSLDGLDTPVQDSDRISIVPAMAGGKL